MNNPNFNEILNGKVPETKPCKRCNGTGTDQSVWHYNANEPDKSRFGPGPCKECNQTGKIAKPDFNAIYAAVTKTTKENKTALRKSKPALKNEFANLSEGRIYFVWRIIRFHGGVDVTMPMNAEMAIHYDPYHDELDQFASALAKIFLGTDMAAAYRWMNALGHNIPVPNNQPETAFSCGPVVTDNNKPPMEQLELK